MARKAYGDHATQVNLSTYPDDGSSPVGSAEWNESLDNEGMLGFTPQTANSSTIIISSGVATITDSVSVIAGEGAATDTLQKLALANTSQYDLVYLFAASSGYVVTLEHGDLNADGEISTVSGANEALSTTVPTILIRKGNYWYGYGGGAVPTTITIADESSDATCFPLFATAATGDLAPKSGTNLTFNSSTGVLTATGFAGPITGAVTGNADTATLATTVTITDNEATNESNALIFTAGGDVDGGNLGLESDGNCTYNPSTGTITATGFAGALTGNVTGNASGTALTVTQAAQTAITSVGTLTSLGSGAITTSGTLTMGDNIITGIKSLDTDVDTLAFNATTAVDFNTNEELILGDITANITFTGTNMALGKHKIFHMESDGSARTFTFPSGWVFYGTKPTTTVASKKSILSLSCIGTAEADVRVVFVEEA